MGSKMTAGHAQRRASGEDFSCKFCKDDINRGDLRIGWGAGLPVGVTGTPCHGIGPRWCHADCFVQFINTQFVAPAAWLQDHLPDSLAEVPGMENLGAHDRTVVQNIFLQGMGKSKSEVCLERSLELVHGNAS